MGLFKKLKNFIIVGFLFLANSNLFANSVNITISCSPNPTVLGQTSQLDIKFENAQNAPAPNLVLPDGLNIQYLGPSQQFIMINGKVSQSITHSYLIIPQKTGQFKIGPFNIEYQGKTYTTNEITLQVSAPSRSVLPGDTTSNENFSLENSIFLVWQPEKEEGYDHEYIKLKLKLYVRENLHLRYETPEQIQIDNTIIEPWEETGKYVEKLSGVNYKVVEWQTAIIPLKPDQIKLPEIGLNCEVILPKPQIKKPRINSPFDNFFSDDFFDNFFNDSLPIPYKVKTQQYSLKILPLPEDNKPKNFDGAVGQFNFIVKLPEDKLKQGEPATLKMIIQGEGNFPLIRAPQWTSPDWKIYRPSVKEEKGEKIFEQIIVPLKSGKIELPQIIFNYFDPNQKKYKSISQGPFVVEVAKGDNITKNATNIDENYTNVNDRIDNTSTPYKTKGPEIKYIKEDCKRFYPQQRFLFQEKQLRKILIIYLLLMAAAIAAIVFGKQLKNPYYYNLVLLPRRKKKEIVKLFSQINNYPPKEIAYRLGKLFVEYLAAKTQVKDSLIDDNSIRDILVKYKLEEKLINEISEVIKQLTKYSYAQAEDVDYSMVKELLQQSLKIIDKLESRFKKTKFIAIKSIIFILAILSLNSFAFPVENKVLFKKANELYQNKKYDQSLKTYLAIYNSGWESKELLYNIANCYVKLSQPGRALLFYYRSLIRDGQDKDVQDNIESVNKYFSSGVLDNGLKYNLIMKMRFLFSLDQLTIIALVIILVLPWLVILLLVFPKYKKIFYVSMVILIVVLIALVFWIVSNYNFLTQAAVVLFNNVETHYEPFKESAVYYNLKLGEIVKITGKETNWYKIKNWQGKEAWVIEDNIALLFNNKKLK